MAAVAVVVTKPKFRYLSAWYCPYAHRATIALEHHKDSIDYEWVEALEWKQQTDTNNVTGTGQEWYYHWKADELKRVNPSALVPTLIPMVPLDPTAATAGTTASEAEAAVVVVDESKAVWESLVVVDYIDMVAAAVSGNVPRTNRLVPTHDPYQTARCRIWAEKVNRDCCSPYYGVLVRKEEEERMEHFQKLLAGLTEFSKELNKTAGPTFLADAQLSSVDIALIPWAYRYYVLEHYRGPEYAIPREDNAVLQPYWEWYDHVMNLACVRTTLPDKEQCLQHYQKYADGSARSKVANAVRRGVAAHELDDEKDEY